MKGLAVAVMVAGLGLAVGLYAGLHEVANEFHRGVSLSGGLFLSSPPGQGLDVSVHQ
jgi:hypothetical protein